MTKNNKNATRKPTEVKLSRVFFHYWKFTKKYKGWYLLISTGFIFGNVVFIVGTPYFSKKLIDIMSMERDLSEVWLTFSIIVGIFILSSILLRTSTALNIKYQMKTIVTLYYYVFNTLNKHSIAFFENTFVGALVNKADKFVVAFEDIMDIFMLNLFITVGQVIVSIGVLFFINIKLGLMSLLWFVIYLIVNILFVRKLLKIDFKKAQTITNRVSLLADTIGNILNLKIFASQNIENKKYENIVNKARDAVLISWNFQNKQEIVNAFLFLVLEFFTVGYIIKLWSVNKATIGDVVLVQSYFLLFLTSLWSVGKAIKKIVKAIADAKEMVEILDQDIEIKDIKNAKKLKVIKGEIVFQNTTFSYPNQKENIFNSFNLKIPAGQRVGLVGTSGAGKTTITKLLLRFIDLDKGKILVDEQNIAKVTQNSLRNNISYVPQEPVLFHRSIYENIAYANPTASKKEILEASKKAHVDEFVQTLEGGYDTLVGERGVKLSGGQKQRMAIARAFLKNAPILVLDEATSALDSVSEELIQDALFNLMKGKTVIVVAHRLSTVQRLDRILVIEDGEIREDGSHQKLLQKNGLYKNFWKKQTRRFLEE